jgi:hypothetical protein
MEMRPLAHALRRLPSWIISSLAGRIDRTVANKGRERLALSAPHEGRARLAPYVQTIQAQKELFLTNCQS